MVPGPTAWPSPETQWEIQVLRSQPRIPESETLRVGSRNLFQQVLQVILMLAKVWEFLSQPNYRLAKTEALLFIPRSRQTYRCVDTGSWRKVSLLRACLRYSSLTAIAEVVMLTLSVRLFGGHHTAPRWTLSKGEPHYPTSVVWKQLRNARTKGRPGRTQKRESIKAQQL